MGSPQRVRPLSASGPSAHARPRDHRSHQRRPPRTHTAATRRQQQRRPGRPPTQRWRAPLGASARVCSSLARRPASASMLHAREAGQKSRAREAQIARQLEQAREAAACHWGQVVQRQDEAAATAAEQAAGVARREQQPRNIWGDYDPDAPDFTRNPRAIEVRRRKLRNRNHSSEGPPAVPLWTRTIPPDNPRRTWRR